MSFWEVNGVKPTGKPEDAFSNSFRNIPDGTQANAMISSAKVSVYDNEKTGINIAWKIVDGDFKGCIVNQSIKVFDKKDEKRIKALNMLKLIMVLCSFTPSHDGEPTDVDLASLKGNICGIKIQQWQMQNKKTGIWSEGNWVSEVHKDIEVLTGIPLEPLPSNDATYNDAQNTDWSKPIEDDISW
jgi:hypothetical protein